MGIVFKLWCLALHGLLAIPMVPCFERVSERALARTPDRLKGRVAE